MFYGPMEAMVSRDPPVACVGPHQNRWMSERGCDPGEAWAEADRTCDPVKDVHCSSYCRTVCRAGSGEESKEHRMAMCHDQAVTPPNWPPVLLWGRR